jgi:hypothetical protein
MSDLRSEMEDQYRRQREIEQQAHKAALRQRQEHYAKRQRRIREALESAHEETAPLPPMTVKVNRASVIRAAAQSAIEATADLNEDLIAQIRDDPELRGQVEAAASAWMLLAQYVADDS